MKRMLAIALTTLSFLVSVLVFPGGNRADALAGATVVSVSSSFACAVDSAGAAWCWGANGNGQLGDGSTVPHSVPAVVSGGLQFTTVATGQFHACGITISQDAYCWGYNSYGQLGDSTNTGRSAPTAVTGSLKFTSISAGRYFTCAVAVGGTAYCWGENGNGELGDGTNMSRTSPTAVTGGNVFSEVTARTDGSHACAITTAGVAYCWGQNTDGQLGDTSNIAKSNPTAVSGGLVFRDISAGVTHTCGVTTSHSAYCWGNNGQGQFGNNGFVSSLVPTTTAGGISFNTIASGYYNTCAIAVAGSTYCWGPNGSGAVGDGTTSSRGSPTLVSTASKFGTVSLGSAAACATTQGGSILCWGDYNTNVMGNNATENQLVPTSALFLYGSGTTTVSVSVDPYFAFAVGNKATACNGESNFASSAGTATTVDLGRLTGSSNVSGGQALSVTGNAGNGFTVYVRGSYASQNLRSPGHNWADVTGTYASPAALGANESFGYTYKDSTPSSSVTNPGSSLFVALDATNRAVMGSGSSLTGSGCVSFDAQTSSGTPAGSYSASIYYVAVPAF